MRNTAHFLPRGTFTRRKFDRILIAATLTWLVSFIDACADTVLAGILLDDTAVSAVSLVQPIFSIVCFVSYLTAVGTVAVFSRESGAFRQEKAYQAVGQGLICSTVFAVFLTAAMLLLRDPYLAYYQASEEITALAREYFTCEIFFAAVFPFYGVIFQLVAIDGDAVCGFIASTLCAVANIVFSVLLAGKLGVKGLAYGSIIGTALAIAAYSTHYLRKTNSVHVRFHFNFREVVEILKTGSATSMTYLYVAVIDIVMNRFIIAKFGDAYLPAYAVVNFILNMAAIFGGLYDSCSGFVGVAYGEKNPASIRQTMHIAYRGAVVVSVLLLVIMELIAPSVPELFAAAAPEIYAAALFAARVLPAAFPVVALYYLFASYYPLTGHVWLSHVLSGLYMFVTPLVLALPLGIFFGFDGMSVGFMLTSVVSVLITALVVRLKYGKKAVPLILEETEEEAIFHEMILKSVNISALCEKVNDELTERGVDSSVRNEVELILEESYMTIMERNEGKKVLTECNLLISDQSLRLITRDNGRIFDITDANAKVKDLRSYVLARLMENNPGRSNTTTVSFNRNSYLWQLRA